MLVLASSSPRRKQLLALGGWRFSIVTDQVDERAQSGELPGQYACRLAEAKARAVLPILDSNLPSDTLVIGADTSVVDWNDEPGENFTILGKPMGEGEAEQMLRRLRGGFHQVISAIAVIHKGSGAVLSDACSTEVLMRDYSDAEMRVYIASGDPFDKAGAYAVQHPVFRPVERLEGCYANVMGLPVCHLTRMLERFGLRPVNNVAEACQKLLAFTCHVFEEILSAETDKQMGCL